MKKTPTKNEVRRNPDSQVSVYIQTFRLTILLQWHNFFSRRLMIFFLNSLHQLCQVWQDSLLQIFHEGTTDLPDSPLATLKMLQLCNCRKKICTVSIFHKVLLIQELSCILLKTYIINPTCCSVAKSQNSSQTHHTAFLASY